MEQFKCGQERNKMKLARKSKKSKENNYREITDNQINSRGERKKYQSTM